MSSEKEAAEVPSWQQPLDGEWKMLKLWGRSNNILAQPILLLSGGLWEPNQVFSRPVEPQTKYFHESANIVENAGWRASSAKPRWDMDQKRNIYYGFNAQVFKEWYRQRSTCASTETEIKRNRLSWAFRNDVGAKAGIEYQNISEKERTRFI